MNNASVVPWVAIASILVTVSIFLAQVIFKTGVLTAEVNALKQLKLGEVATKVAAYEALNLPETAARVKDLEDWRKSIRLDMHEISDSIQAMSNKLEQLKTIIQERTERRAVDRS